MEDYRQDQERQQKNSRLAGAGLAVVASAIMGVGLAVDGFTYLDPPPPDYSFITLEVPPEPQEEEEQKKPKQEVSGTQPTTENPDPENELVQQSKSPNEGEKENLTEESTMGKVGDVAVPEPPRELVQQKYLYSNAKNPEAKDTLAMQTSSDPSFELKPGHPSGNIEEGPTKEEPKVELPGRSTIGDLPLPTYGTKGEGKVVVKIKVDRNGTVVEAQPGVQGTTLNEKTAWEAAKKAALETEFSVTSDEREYQYGTITYKFTITQ